MLISKCLISCPLCDIKLATAEMSIALRCSLLSLLRGSSFIRRTSMFLEYLVST